VLQSPTFFSIIIPLYNKEKSITSTIDSVLKQTYPHFELIIVNDGSTDQSLDKLKSFKDSRMVLIDKINGGVSSARNRGIEVAKNSYITFLDADDYWYPFCLEEFSHLIEKFSDCEVFCTNYNMTGKKLLGSNRRYIIKDYYYASSYFLAKWSIPVMITGCVCVKKEVFQRIHMFNETITHGEDIDLWERLSKNYKIAKSELVTTIYRTEAENRASLINEELKLNYYKQGEELSKNSTQSQKLYYSLQLIFELISEGYNKSKYVKSLLKQTNVFCLFKAIFFIFKMRYFNTNNSQL
jgi:glycosyltransferase involved in cell wall biosynthesis